MGSRTVGAGRIDVRSARAVHRALVAAGVFAAALGVGTAAELPASSPAPGVCAAYADPPRQTGTIPKELHELSGIVASRKHPGVFWAHNDSGNPLELFAIDALFALFTEKHQRAFELLSKTRVVKS